MRLLDEETYSLVEWRLHHETLMLDTVRDFESDVLQSSRGTDYSEPVVISTGNVGDPVSRKAFLLADGTVEVRRARRWLRVIKRTREWFSDSQEGKFYALYFGGTASLELVAAGMGISRQWAGKLRDNVVFRGTMYAIEERLFRLEDADGGKERERA